MSNNNRLTFVEKLKFQLKEEQRKYRDALNSNTEFWELKEIKEKIKRLQASLQLMLTNLHRSC